MEFESEVGTIVWVRRRNGSWWPGKILGGEELSASHLMSPRSGTPVKLLGREDASVDWYNLEKSKRVKPFRCGEFDDCITRAQASQGMPPKKREKYARREDAILHALELEKQFLHKKYPNLQTPLPLNSKPVNNNNPPPPPPPPAPASYHHNGDDDNDDVDLSPQDTIKRKRPRHDDDNDKEEESINKRRLNTSPKLPPNPMPLQTHPPLLLVEEDNKTQVADPPVMAAAAAAAAATASGDSSDHTPDHLLQGEKRKPSPEDQSMQLQLDHKEHPKSDESFDYNQTPLSDWVDVSTPKSQNAFTFGLSEENNTTEEDDDDDEEDEDDEDEEEDTETDSSGTESLSSDTYDATLSDDADQIEFIPKVFGRSETGEDESMSDADESDESLPTSVTVSKWQLKGKRNTRSLMKRYRNASSDNKLLVGSSQWMSYRGGEDRLAADSFDKRLRSQAIGFNMPTRDVGLDSSHDIINSVEGYWEQQPTDYHDSSLAYMSSLQFGGRMKSMLIDVDVQVQSGYQREHVPMISLMSKLNDKAIVGHPIPVETIQDGSSDIILSAAETYEYQTESLVLDPDDTALQPWRTARRTAKCRVPRPPAQDEYAAADEERKHNNRKGGSISRKWPSQKLQKKPQRRSVLSHSQKIRTLSSIGGGGDQISDLRAEEGVMKPAAAAVACIPVKLVFSRLHEELVARHQ